MKNIYLFALLLFIVVLVYSSTISGEFQFDDDIFISESDLISAPLKVFEKGVMASFVSGIRPVTQLTLNLNYAVGGFQVKGYHAVNILIHLLSTSAVYIFLRMLFVRANTENTFGFAVDRLALVAAALFALHPLQTESVAYIVQRAEALASLFYLLGLYCLLRYTTCAGSKQLLFGLSGLICFLLGLGSKETILTMPLIFVLFVLFMDTDRTSLKKSLVAISPVLIVCIIFILAVASRLKGNQVVGFDIKGLGQPEYLYTEAKVLLTYLRLIFLPVNQNFDYDYPLSRHLFSPETLCALSFWVAAVALSIYALRIDGRWKWHFRLMGFGMLWFLIILSPTSTLVPLRDVILEHRTYLPLLGIIIAILAAADMLYQYLKGGKDRAFVVFAFKISAILLIIVLAAVAHERNEVWKTRLSLWQDVVEKSPNKARGHNNLGNCYYLAGDYDRAVREFQAAITLDPEFVEPYYNMAISFKKLGREAEAEISGLMFNEKVLRLK